MRRENWSHGSEEEGCNSDVDLVEKEKGNSVFTTATVVEKEGASQKESKKTSLVIRDQSGRAHGKEKESGAKAGISQIEGEEKGLQIEDMIWQTLVGEEELTKMGRTDGANGNIGCEETQLLSNDVLRRKQMDQSRAQGEETEKSIVGSGNFERTETQSKWKRLAREDNRQNEKAGQRGQCKTGERGEMEGEWGNLVNDKQGKRRKLEGDSSTIFLAVAIEQPRHTQ